MPAACCAPRVQRGVLALRRKPFVAVAGNWLGVHQGEGPHGRLPACQPAYLPACLPSGVSRVLLTMNAAHAHYTALPPCLPYARPRACWHASRCPAGECFCLLGPNGAGKSTTINCLVGALPLSAGVCGVAREEAVVADGGAGMGRANWKEPSEPRRAVCAMPEPCWASPDGSVGGGSSDLACRLLPPALQAMPWCAARASQARAAWTAYGR